jgi:hypothetical protein
VSEATGAAGPTPNRTRTIVLGVVVVLFIGAGSFWLLRTVFHVGRSGRVDLYGFEARRGYSIERFTIGYVDESTIDSSRGENYITSDLMRRLEKEGKIMLVVHNTPVVVLYTKPPYSWVRLSYGREVREVREVWISTGTIHFDE